MEHYKEGKTCDCRMTFSDDPQAYAEEHPNKKGPNGETFNDSINESRRAGDRYVSYYYNG